MRAPVQLHRKIEALIAERHPIYAEADITVESAHGPAEATLDRVMAALAQHVGATSGVAS